MERVEVKPMTRQELRIELEWFCGCESPELAAATLLRILELHPLFEHRAEMEELMPHSGIEHLVLYRLSDRDLTEHGGTVTGGWLTEKGEAVKTALNAEAGDSFEALFADHCVHGFDIDDDSHDCFSSVAQVTADEFEAQSAERLGMSIAEHRASGHVIVPCYCGHEGCEGWQQISRELMLEREGILKRPSSLGEFLAASSGAIQDSINSEGSIGVIKCYARALTPEEVATLYFNLGEAEG